MAVLTFPCTISQTRLTSLNRPARGAAARLDTYTCYAAGQEQRSDTGKAFERVGDSMSDAAGRVGGAMSDAAATMSGAAASSFQQAASGFQGNTPQATGTMYRDCCCW